MHRLAFAIVTMASVVARADAPTADAKKQAAEHFERGRSAYSFGNYDVAIAEYQAAFDLTHAPEYVFNIAQTYRTKGDKPKALEFYKQYLELDPQGIGVESARSHIAALEAELKREAEEAENKRRAAEAADKARRDQQAAAADAARRDAAEVARRRVADAEAARSQQTSRTLRISGLAAGGAGLATIGVGAYFGLRARALSHDARPVDGMWTEDGLQSISRANSAQRTMYILLASGGAAAVTGGVLYMLGARKRESQRIAVTPIAGGAALVIGGAL